jgi:hypothetical protein
MVRSPSIPLKCEFVTFNSRCGHCNDYIEGVDDIVPIVIDNTENLKGDLFIEFLRDINFAMLNGRIGVNDFTCISPRGRSVVDYIWNSINKSPFKFSVLSITIGTISSTPSM